MGNKRLGTLFFSIVFLTFIFLGFLLISGFAQSPELSQSLEVGPPSQEVSADPGSTLQVKTTLRNRSRATLPIAVRIEDFTASGDEGQVALVNAGAYSIVSWTTVSPSRFNLDPGESQTVTATVKIPKNAAGGRYGSFVFSVTNPNQEDNSNAKVAQEIGSLFLLRLSGPVSESLTLTNLEIPHFLESAPVPFSLKFKNSGNVHLKTAGVINVSNMINQKVADVPVKAENIFPGAERTLQATLDNKFLLGRYTATAIMYYGGKNEIITASTSFIVFPIRIAAVIVVIAFVFFLIRKRLIKAIKVLLS